MPASNVRAAAPATDTTPSGRDGSPVPGSGSHEPVAATTAAHAGRPAWVEDLRRPGVLALACVAIFGVAFTVQAQFDPDFWWHVLVGDRILNGSFPHTDPFTFTAVGHQFIPQEWGSEVLYALLLHLGMWAVICLMAVVTVAGLALALGRARAYTNSPAVLAAAGTLGLAVAVSTFGPRSQMFTFAFTALLLTILDRHRKVGGRVAWWCVPLFCLWGNLHGGFTIGLGLVVIVMVGDAVEHRLLPGRARGPARTRTLALMLAASVAVIGVNPNGYAMLAYSSNLLANSVAQANLQEWRSPSFHDLTFLPLALLIALLVVCGAKARRVPLSDVLLAAAGVVLTLYAVRNLSLVIVLTAPLLIDGLDAWTKELGLFARRPGRLGMPFCALAVAIATAVSGVVIAERLADPLNTDRSAVYPVAVADALCAAPASNLLEPYGSAGWLLFEMVRGAPRPCAFHPVFIWGDAYTVGPQLFQEYLDAVAARPDTISILDTERVQTVWQSQGDALPVLLQRTPGWTCVLGVGGQVVFTRSSLAGAWHSDRSGCP